MKYSARIANRGFTQYRVNMATQKHMGKNQLIDRLSAQVGSREMAIGILQSADI